MTMAAPKFTPPVPLPVTRPLRPPPAAPSGPAPVAVPGAPAGRAIALLRALRIETDAEGRDRLIAGLLARGRPTMLGFVNAHALNLAWARPECYAAFRRADLLLRDGAGLRIWLRALGREPGLNLNGTDLIPRILAACAGRRLAVFGTAAPWLDIATARLAEGGAAVVASADGFRPDADYVALCREAEPEVILLALGMPRQEELAELLRRSLAHPCLIICGGAILDFLAGRFSRAPRLMRRFGLEWAYRLMQEPRRLFRRYVFGIPLSFWRLWRVRRALARAGAPAPEEGAAAGGGTGR